MRNAIAAFSAVIALLSLGSSGCSSPGKSKDRVALDQAYQSGVLNKGEYEIKKAALESQTAALDALDKALAAGVVTPADYPALKARLIAKGTALAALERAHQAGVFTEPEYLAKKAALSAADASTAIPASSDPNPAPPASTPSAPSPASSAAPPNPANVASVSPPSRESAPAAARTPPPPQPLEMTSTPKDPPAASTAPTASASAHALRMKMASAIDQSGFERPMPSFSLLIPVDWQSQGGTTWNIKDKCNTIQTTFRAYGPDGRGLEFFPVFNWVWADDPGPLRMTAAQTAQYGTRPCDVAPPMSAADYLRRNLARYRPNAQLVGIEPAPKLLAAMQQQAHEGEQAAVQYNLKQAIRPDAVKGRVRYNVDGKAVEEWIIVATITTGTLGPSYNTRTMQMGQAYTYNCVAFVTGERAPQGQLDASERLFDLIVSSSRVNPAWQAKVNGNAQAMQAIELKGVRDRSAIVSKNAEDISNIRRQSYENTQRSQDRISEQFSQNMRGVETYRNPSTGETVDLSNQYGHAWVNNRGEYLLSDQPGFDPSVTFKEDWRPLERVSK